ncbi:MAG: cell division protein CrgA [Micrococcales bacterium]
MSDKKKSSKPAVENHSNENAPNPVWFKPVMFGFMILGFLWILVYYITEAQYPLGASAFINLSNWNILIGFGIAMVGFVMTTRWK